MRSFEGTKTSETQPMADGNNGRKSLGNNIIINLSPTTREWLGTVLQLQTAVSRNGPLENGLQASIHRDAMELAKISSTLNQRIQ